MSSDSNEIEEFRLRIKTKFLNKRLPEKPIKFKNMRLVTIRNQPHLQIICLKRSRFREHNLSNVAGIFLSCNLYGICFKLIFSDMIISFFQDDKFQYETFQKILKERIDSYQKNSQLCSKSKRSSSIANERPKAVRLDKRSMSVVLNQYSNEENNTYYVNDHPLQLADVYSKIDLHSHVYTIPELNLEVDPLNENLQFKMNSPNEYIYQLRNEIAHNGGVKIEFSEKCLDKYTLTIINNELWVSDVYYHDNKEKKLHFGDRIVAVDKNEIKNIFCFQEHIRGKRSFFLTVQRLPKAKVFILESSKNLKIKGKKRFVINDFVSNNSWQITELNDNILINNTEDTLKRIKEEIKPIEMIGVVLHEITFVKSLHEQNKDHRKSITFCL